MVSIFGFQVYTYIFVSHYTIIYIREPLYIYIYIYIYIYGSTSVCIYIYIYTHTHTGASIYIYIYIYIFTNLLSASIHGYQKKNKKTPGTRDKNISNHRLGEKEKNIIGQKERKGQPRHTRWKKSRDMQSVGQKKIKTHRQRCNATITRVLNTSGANYKINLNRESEFSY